MRELLPQHTVLSGVPTTEIGFRIVIVFSTGVRQVWFDGWGDQIKNHDEGILRHSAAGVAVIHLFVLAQGADHGTNPAG